MKYFAPAKINLFLDVLNKRDDGYHNLSMIMQTIDLCDEIDIEKAEKILLECNKDGIPLNEKNLVWKAADLFFEYTKINGGCKIYLKKVIPDGAGLGGGSSDAAQVLIALNEIYDTKLSNEQLKGIAVKIGADVPFFIDKGCCLAEGIGDILTPIENNTNPYVLVYKPEVSISTKWVYESLNLNNKKEKNKDELIELLRVGNMKFYDGIFNVLEDVSITKYPEIEDVKNKFKNLGATNAMMTGSGSAVFAIFIDEIKAKEALGHFEKERIFFTKFI